jgi:mRNA interferase MazF
MVSPGRYIPDRGDIVWIALNPQAGHEQAGRRPALVLTPRDYNSKTKLAIFSPITSQVKGYPFEIDLPKGLPMSGVILSDQVKSLDWQARNVELITNAPDKTISSVMDKLGALLT